MKEQRDAILARARSLQRAQRAMMEDLIDLREKHELSQQDVAQRMGVSQSAVAQFERYDSNPTLSSIQRYALAVEAKLELKVASDRESSHDFVAEKEKTGKMLRLALAHAGGSDIDWRGAMVTHAAAR